MKKIILIAVAFTLLLSACGAPAAEMVSITQNGIEISQAWVRAASMKSEMGAETMPAHGAVSGAFMLIKNSNAEADLLLKASSDAAEMVQIHETTMQAGVMSMAEVPGITIPTGSAVELKPGSYHIMLIGLKRELKQGETISINLSFQNAGDIGFEIPAQMP